MVSPQQNLVAVPLPPRTQQPSPPKPTSHINGGGDSKPPIVPTIQQQPQRIQRPPVTTPAYVMAANPNVPQQMMEAPPNINREPPQPPREQRPPRHREDPIQDLRKFSQDFKLVTSEPPPQQTNQISPPLEQLQQPPPPVIPQQQPLIGKPPQQSPPQQQPPPPQITPPQQSEPITETMDKVSTAFKKSTLNPNAKEFVYNPKSNFTQRSPSTPSASRPHTPQTPHTSPYVPQAAVSMAPTGQQPMPMVMPAAYVVTSQPTYQPPPHSQSNRFRKGKNFLLFRQPVGKVFDFSKFTSIRGIVSIKLSLPGDIRTEFTVSESCSTDYRKKYPFSKIFFNCRIYISFKR